jgi:hypothetical protein
MCGSLSPILTAATIPIGPRSRNWCVGGRCENRLVRRPRTNNLGQAIVRMRFRTPILRRGAVDPSMQRAAAYEQP